MTCYESLLGYCPMFWMKRCIKEYRPKLNNDESKPNQENGVELVTATKKAALRSRSASPRSSMTNFELSDITIEGDNIDENINRVSCPRSNSVSYTDVSTTKTIEKLLTLHVTDTGSNRDEQDEGKVNIETASKEKLYKVLKLEHDKIANHIDGVDTGNYNFNRRSDIRIVDDDDHLHSNDVNQNRDGNLNGTGNGNYATASRVKLAIMYQIKHKLFNERYSKYPYWCKYVSIGFIIIWTFLCATITTIWCIWFDVSLETNNEYEEVIYNATMHDEYIDLTTWINYNETQKDIDVLIEKWEQNGHSLYNPPANDSYSNGSMSVSSRFLITVFVSYCLSLFFWQPLIFALRAWMLLKKLEKNPDKITEALLFSHKINGININDHETVNIQTSRNLDNDNGESRFTETSI